MNNKIFITVTDSRSRGRVMLPIDKIVSILEAEIGEKAKGIHTIINWEDNGYITARETFDYIVKEIEVLNNLNV